MAIASPVLKPMPRMSRANPVGVLCHDLNGIGAIGLEDSHYAGGADPMAVRNTMISRTAFCSAQAARIGRTNRGPKGVKNTDTLWRCALSN